MWTDLKKFYDTRYSADRMAVTVVGREPIDTLEGFVRDRFAAVTSTENPPVDPVVPIYTADQLGVRIHVAPLDEIRELYVEFPVPTQRETYRSHALGHRARRRRRPRARGAVTPRPTRGPSRTRFGGKTIPAHDIPPVV